MATSKKPRKKHDKNANIKRQSDRICRNSLVLSVIGLGNDGTEWIKNNIPQDVTMTGLKTASTNMVSSKMKTTSSSPNAPMDARARSITSP